MIRITIQSRLQFSPLQNSSVCVGHQKKWLQCQEALGVLLAVEAILGTGVIAVRKHLISRRQSQPATYVLGFNSRIDKEVAVRIQNASSLSCNEKQNHDTFWIICLTENHDGK